MDCQGRVNLFVPPLSMAILNKSLLFIFLFLTVIGYVFISVNACLWGSEGNLGDQVLSFHRVRPGDQTVVLRLRGAIAC